MWKYQKNKRASHRYWEKKVYKNTISKQKSECIRIHRWEKKDGFMHLWIQCVLSLFPTIFFLVFLFHKLSGTYPSSLGIAWVFRYTQFWKVLIFFFNLIKSFRTPFKKKRQQKISISAFQNPFFSSSFLFLNTDEFVFKIHFSRLHITSKPILLLSYTRLFLSAQKSINRS